MQENGIFYVKINSRPWSSIWHSRVYNHHSDWIYAQTNVHYNPKSLDLHQNCQLVNTPYQPSGFPWGCVGAWVNAYYIPHLVFLWGWFVTLLHVYNHHRGWSHSRNHSLRFPLRCRGVFLLFTLPTVWLVSFFLSESEPPLSRLGKLCRRLQAAERLPYRLVA